MATRKNNNNTLIPQNVNQAVVDQAAAQAEPKAFLAEFSKWVSFAGIALSTDRLFGDKKEAFAPEPVVERAWEILSQPSIMAARYIGIGTKLDRNSNRSGFTSGYYSSPDAVLNAALAGLTEDQAFELALALDRLAQKLDVQVAGPEIKEAAKQASKLWVAPASAQSLGYPALGIGLAESYTMVDGKRQKTLSGQQLVRVVEGGGGQAMAGRVGLD